jgi:hypothetical protein
MADMYLAITVQYNIVEYFTFIWLTVYYDLLCATGTRVLKNMLYDNDLRKTLTFDDDLKVCCKMT